MPRERLLPECIGSTAKLGGGGIIVWGYFSCNGLRPLIPINLWMAFNSCYCPDGLSSNRFQQITKM
ncbi:unnamed protein product [Larinioides sclopetarius]|uniref:Uncharacterized protein n=1 Tax=Larinioides sclopetarius TaxID=280406 RepID=A0AAV1YS77_9ARAC